MTRKGEASYSAFLKKQFERAGAFVMLCHPSIYGGRGWPDLYVSHKSVQFWAELKVGDNKPDALQRDTIAKLKKTGTLALVMRKSAAGEEYLEDENGNTLLRINGNGFNKIRQVASVKNAVMKFVPEPPTETKEDQTV